MADTTNQIKSVVDSWDAAWTKKNAEGMRNLFAPDVVLHADGLLMNQDMKGVDAVVGNFAKYFDRYDFDHSCMNVAVNPDNGSVFGFWQDTAKSGNDTVAGIWKAKVRNGKIQDIYFLRRMHEAEKQARLRDPSSIETGPIEYESVKSIDMSKAGSDFQSTIRDVARRYSEIWQTGNVDIADDICHPSFQSYDLLKGGELVSKDAFKNMIKEVFKFWHPETSDIDIATTPGDNKAFVHWTATGKLQDRAEKVTTFGLNLLEVDPEGGKILRSAGFRQLEPNEVEAMLKEDAFKKLEQ